MSQARLDALNRQVLALMQQGRFSEAIPSATEAVALAERILGPAHHDTALSLNYLAQLYHAQGRYGEAEPFYRRGLAIMEQALGPAHPAIAQGISYLAKLYDAQGRYGEAEPLYRRALAIREQALGPDHADTALSLNNLAAMYYSRGRYGEAEPLYRRALAIREQALGPDHPDTALSLNNLAAQYWVQDRYEEAEPLYRRALAIREQALGPDHADTALSLNNLALLYRAQGRYGEAEPLYRRALAINEHALGSEHPRTASSLNNLALLYRAQGRYEKAEPLYRRALAIWEQALGREHPDTALSLNNLAMLYQAQSRYGEAEPLNQRALSIREQALGPDHPYTAESLNNLALLYLAQGRYEEAEPLLRRALAICEQALGPSHSKYVSSLINLAFLSSAKGQAPEALRLMQRALASDEWLIAQVFAAGGERARVDFLTTRRGSQDAFLSLIRQAFADDRTAVGAALERVLRRKAIGAEVLAAQRDAVLGGRYPELRPKLAELTALRAQIAQAILAGPGAEEVQAHRERLAQWSAQREVLEAELARQIPEMNLEQRLRGVDRAAVARALPPDSALVEYVCFEEFDFQAVPARGERQWKGARYLAFVLRAGAPEEVAMLDLGEAAFIDRRIAALRAAVTGESEETRGRRAGGHIPSSAPTKPGFWQRLFGRRNAAPLPVFTPGDSPTAGNAAELIQDIRSRGEELRQLIFDPLRAVLGTAGRLFVSPDGDLNRLPFEILPLEDGDYLIDAYRLSYLGAGRDLLRFGARATHPAAALVVADPDFDLGAGSHRATASETPARGRRSRDLKPADLHFERLEDTRLEGEYIAQALGTHPWVQAQSLDGRLKATRSPRVLHLATHGFFLPDQPQDPAERGFGGLGDGPRLRGPGMENPLLRSGLALAGANTFLGGGQPPKEAEDGLLTAEDVTGLDLLDTELVVLSACETGLGEVKTGEGVFGLRRAFVLAGAQTLVMSLWQVADEQTLRLMERFYEGLLAGQPRSEALRSAQLALRASYPDPYFWGAFILQGEIGPLGRY